MLLIYWVGTVIAATEWASMSTCMSLSYLDLGSSYHEKWISIFSRNYVFHDRKTPFRQPLGTPNPVNLPWNHSNSWNNGQIIVKS